MKDIVTLLAAAEQLRASGDEGGVGGGGAGVLVTLVHTSGSTYRRPGARMLVLPGCRTVGTISGGCLEPAVAKEAWERTRAESRVCFSCESAPEDDTWGPASGCHGILYLLAERLGPAERHPALELLRLVRATHRPALVAHYFDNRSAGELKPVGGQHDSRWQGEEQVTLANATSRWVEHDGVAAFLECLQPPTHLLICGAGDDAQPLERIAAELAWSVDVIDTRGRLATRERFARADHVIADSPERVATLVHPHTAAVLMSHRFADDLEFLGQLLGAGGGGTSPAYIGLLGPRRRADRLLEELARRDIRPTARQSAALRSPVGLDLGSNSPETIALAVVAEIQAALAQRDARPLSNRVGPIHGPLESRPAMQASARRAGECAI